MLIQELQAKTEGKTQVSQDRILHCHSLAVLALGKSSTL